MLIIITLERMGSAAQDQSRSDIIRLYIIKHLGHLS